MEHNIRIALDIQDYHNKQAAYEANNAANLAYVLGMVRRYGPKCAEGVAPAAFLFKAGAVCLQLLDTGESPEIRRLIQETVFGEPDCNCFKSEMSAWGKQVQAADLAGRVQGGL